MAANLFQKFFNAVNGVDQSTNDLLRDPSRAKQLSNARVNYLSNLTGRRGEKLYAPDSIGWGMYTYSYTDEDSVIQEELIGLAGRPYRLTFGALTITAVSGSTSCSYSFLVNEATNTFRFILYQNGVAVTLSGNPYFDCGTGLGNGFVTLTDLKNAIDGHANFTATVTSSAGSAAAAQINITEGTSFTTTTDIEVRYWDAINAPAPIVSLFSTFNGTRNLSTYVTPAAVNLSNCMYFVIPSSIGVLKYDGQTFYNAGLDAPVDPTLADAGAGSIVAGTYKYITTYVQVDNQGNTVEGAASGSASITLSATHDVTVTVTNNVAGSGFNTGCALFAANTAVAPSGGLVTLTVQNTPHTLVAGDTAYFYNRHASVAAYVEYPITSVTSTTIVVSTSATVTTNNNDVVSNNLRVAIYRTKATGTVYRLVAQIPNNSFSSTTAYTDSTLDTALGAAYEYPDVGFEHERFPAGLITVAEHQGLLVAAAENTIYWSTPDSPEYLSPTNNLIIPSTIAGDITALASDTSEMLAVFKKSSYFNVTGALATGDVSVDKITDGDYGVACQGAVQKVKDYTIALGANGFIAVKSGELILDLGYPVSGLIKKFNLEYATSTGTQKSGRTLERTTSVNDYTERLAYWFIPFQANLSGELYANASSLCYVFDYDRGLWFDQSFNLPGETDGTGVNAHGGMTIYGGRLVFAGHHYRDSAVVAHTFRQHKNSSTSLKYDYAANTQAITYDFWFNFLSAGEPSIDKFWQTIKVYCLDPDNFVPFDLRIRTYLNWGTTTADTDLTLSFTASTDIEKVGDLLPNKARTLLIRMTVATIHQAPFISGYELLTKGPFRKDDIRE